MGSIYCQNIKPIKRLINTHYEQLSKKFDIIFSPTILRYDIIQIIGSIKNINRFKILFIDLGFHNYLFNYYYLLDIPNEKYGKLVKYNNKYINKDSKKDSPNRFTIIIPDKEHKKSKVGIYGKYDSINQGIKELSKLLKIKVCIFDLFCSNENTYKPPYRYIHTNYGMYGNIGEPYIDKFKIGDGEVYNGIALNGKYGVINKPV